MRLYSLVVFAFAASVSADDIHSVARTCDLPRLQEILRGSPSLANAMDEQGNTALHEAVKAGKVDCVGVLVRAGANPRTLNHAGISPGKLILTTPDKNLHDRLVTTVLLASQTQPMLGANAPWTLQYASLRGQTEVVRMLLKMGADPNVRGTDGNTPLHEACLKGHVEVAKLLLENNAKVDVRSQAGTLPIHDAAVTGNVPILSLLLARGANVNARTEETGETPLHLAAAWGRVDAIHALLEAGAMAEAQDNKVRTPLETAIENEQSAAAAALRLKLRTR